jgi:hypothetical protein
MTLNLATQHTVAPAKAGAHHVSPLKTMGEIGTSLRWCDGSVGLNSFDNTVTLNLFQGPFIRSSSGCAALWMLKQVQHDEVLDGGIRA